jgi:iron-sulfur cluster assembly protein
LSYDLKFDKAKSEDDKIFIDNEITIAVEKNLLYLAGTILEFSGGINGKGFIFNNPNANRTCGCGEFLSLKRKVLNPRFNFYLDKIIKFNFSILDR